MLFQYRMQTRVRAGFDFVAHVDLGRRAVAHQHYREAGGDAFGFEGGGAGGYVFAQLRGQGDAIYELCGHFVELRRERERGAGIGEFLNAEGAKVTRRAQKRNTKKYQK